MDLRALTAAAHVNSDSSSWNKSRDGLQYISSLTSSNSDLTQIYLCWYCILYVQSFLFITKATSMLLSRDRLLVILHNPQTSWSPVVTETTFCFQYRVSRSPLRNVEKGFPNRSIIIHSKKEGEPSNAEK